LSLNGTSVDGQVPEICQQFLSTVLTLNELEEVRGIVDELPLRNQSNCCSGKGSEAMITNRCPGFPSNEDVVGEETEEERYIGLVACTSLKPENLDKCCNLP
jgi:hypothetical protein